MLGIFKVFGKNKDDDKTKSGTVKKYQNGDKCSGICSHCSKVVTTTWSNKEVECAGINTSVFVASCDDCDSVVTCEDADIEKALKELALRNKQETFASVRGSVEKVQTPPSMPVVIDNDIEAKNALEEAFSPDILNEVGRGNVSVVNSDSSIGMNSDNTISSLLENDGESFHNILRRKEVACKLWVNWLKFDGEATIPCNEIISLSGDWCVDAANENLVCELEEKLIYLSGTDKIAILMLQKLKK